MCLSSNHSNHRPDHQDAIGIPREWMDCQSFPGAVQTFSTLAAEHEGMLFDPKWGLNHRFEPTSGWSTVEASRRSDSVNPDSPSLPRAAGRLRIVQFLAGIAFGHFIPRRASRPPAELLPALSSWSRPWR